MEPINFELFVGKLVKVVYREEPDQPVIVRKGILVGADALFIQLRTESNVFLINLAQIISVKAFGNGEVGT